MRRRRPEQRQLVQGKAEAVNIFGLLGDAEMAASDGFRAWERCHGDMLSAYRGQDWDKARELARQCRGMDGTITRLYELYETRIEEYEANPPGPDWDGAYVATSK